MRNSHPFSDFKTAQMTLETASDICVYGSGNDIGIGREAIEYLALVRYLNMDLAYIVSATGKGLNQEFFERDFLGDQLANGIDRRIDRAVTGSGCDTGFTVDQQTDGSHRDGVLATNDLQVIQLDSSGVFDHFGTGQIAQIVVGNGFLCIGHDEEFAVGDIQFGMGQVVSQTAQVMVECSTPSRAVYDGRIGNADTPDR